MSCLISKYNFWSFLSVFLYPPFSDYTTRTPHPQMRELVEDAIASCCGDIVGHFVLIKNELKKFVKLKFYFFRFNTFDVSQIFWQWVVQPRPKYSYCISLKGLCWGSVCWILNNALCFMSWMFSGFYFVSHCDINILHHMLCYLYIIYYIFVHKTDERILKTIVMNNIECTKLTDKQNLIIYYPRNTINNLVSRNNNSPKLPTLKQTNIIYEYSCCIGDCEL